MCIKLDIYVCLSIIVSINYIFTINNCNCGESSSCPYFNIFVSLVIFIQIVIVLFTFSCVSWYYLFNNKQKISIIILHENHILKWCSKLFSCWSIDNMLYVSRKYVIVHRTHYMDTWQSKYTLIVVWLPSLTINHNNSVHCY